ncbi:MAG: type restriction enzyme [Acidobacteriota bacterium]|nr:type restriction enzyme [Acidobacteriota bacterium]
MKLQFDSSQEYQLNAVKAIVDLFDGQPIDKGDFTIIGHYKGLYSQEQTELGFGNRLILNHDTLLANLHKIQDRNELDRISPDEFKQNELNFTVEMETGTGKTYCFLRTIFELSGKYGFKKYIIVVPSVAIREGANKNIEITKDHFKALYNNIEFEHFVYDSKKANRLRQFAASNHIQIMIINIDAFRKDFSESQGDKKSNVIFKENDRLSGRKPIDFVQATNPIVIIDEPQSVDNTPKAREAIKALNPLCIFRYSATHRNLYNQVYKLDPIRAYGLKLVKQIIVSSVTSDGSHNEAYVKLLQTDNKKGLRAKIRIHSKTPSGIKDKEFWIKQSTDLFELSQELELYRTNYEITEISAEPGNEYIDFSSGKRLYLDQEMGGVKEDLMELQIKQTIQRHLDKEIQLKNKGIKVLSLFFIDRVANYRYYDEEGKPQKGKFARIFEKHYTESINQPKYVMLDRLPVEKVHDGYFSEDKKGILKDTNGTTLADDDTYAKIMRNKEQLLSLDEPLKFIFSHSALREGWDNPNVFQICTLNETRSLMKKRQEIGRGLRLPVNQEGYRVFDENINKLLIVANEHYDEFARKLQDEYEEDCGVTFGKIPRIGFSRITQFLDNKEVPIGPEKSENIWDHLVKKGFIDEAGKIKPGFYPGKHGFTLDLPEDIKELESDIIEVIDTYRIEHHIKKDELPRRLILNKQVFDDAEFKELWNRIKYKTFYEVEYSTKDIINNAVKAIGQMPKIEPIKATIREDRLNIGHKGITTEHIRGREEDLLYEGPLPDIIGYLQKETELTRKTLAMILIDSKRLGEFILNPQKFMDAVSGIIKKELHELIIDGIKYEKSAAEEWSMLLFENEEILSYLHNRLEVRNSVYDAVVFDSEIERKFAEELDKREDIKLFVKLPHWFTIETPIGKYNPDWAIVKHGDQTIYMVRETKGTKNIAQFRNTETYKIKCGRKHFETLKVNFDVVTSVDDI